MIKTIHQLIEEQVIKYSEVTAIVFGKQSITYGEFNKKANQFGRVLQSCGSKPDQLIAIIMDRSIDMFIALLAVLKSGAAYVPIDPNYPTDRIQYIIEDSSAKILIADSSYKFLVDTNIIVLDPKEVIHYQGDDSNIISSAYANHLAYVIYTSGTTGKPKGVMIEHQSVVNLLNSIDPFIHSSDVRNVLLQASYAFDMSVYEIWSSFCNAKTAFLLKENDKKDIDFLLKEIKMNDIHVMQAVPSLLHLLMSVNNWKEYMFNLKHIIVGGEIFDYKLMELAQLPTKIWNAYGPTETTVWSSIKQITSEITIGKALNHEQFLIINEEKQICDVNESGELCITGAGLARGYLNRPDLTTEKFVSHPITSERMYKTGDLARMLPNGEFEHLGRIDHQIKINGFRIECGEIESAILQQEGVIQALVVKHIINNEDILTAYVIGTANEVIIRNVLKDIIPEYMIPHVFIFIDRFPLTTNGKVDRKALPLPELMIDSNINELTIEKWIASQLPHAKGTDMIGLLIMNSFQKIKFINNLKKNFFINIPYDELSKLNLSELCETVKRNEIVIDKKRKFNLEFKEIETIITMNCFERSLINKVHYEGNYFSEKFKYINQFYEEFMGYSKIKSNENLLNKYFFPFDSLMNMKNSYYFENKMEQKGLTSKFTDKNDFISHLISNYLEKNKVAFVFSNVHFLSYCPVYLKKEDNPYTANHTLLIIDKTDDSYLVCDPAFDFFGHVDIEGFEKALLSKLSDDEVDSYYRIIEIDREYAEEFYSIFTDDYKEMWGVFLNLYFNESIFEQELKNPYLKNAKHEIYEVNVGLKVIMKVIEAIQSKSKLEKFKTIQFIYNRSNYFIDCVKVIEKYVSVTKDLNLDDKILEMCYQKLNYIIDYSLKFGTILENKFTSEDDIDDHIKQLNESMLDENVYQKYINDVIYELNHFHDELKKYLNHIKSLIQ